MTRTKQVWITIGVTLALCAGVVSAAEEPADILNLQTALTASSFDVAAYSEWVDAVETQIVQNNADKSTSPEKVIFVNKNNFELSGRSFGAAPVSGVRHLRVGFNKLQVVGTILTVGNVRVSVLKKDAVYPGDISDDTQWEPALRFEDNALTSQEGKDQFAALLWTMPTYTQTRALRFTHTANASDDFYQGRLRGAYILQNRYANIGLQSKTTARSNPSKADLITNGSVDGFWGVWANIPARTGKRLKTIEADPEWFVTYWDKPEKISGLTFFFPGFREADIQVYTGPSERHPSAALESDWQTVKQATGLENLYPFYFGLNLVTFDTELSTRALRVRMTAPENPALCHPHIKDNTLDGKRVWLGEMQVLKSMRSTALESLVVEKPKVSSKAIPINFNLPEAGYVTLVVEDNTGKRVYNLISDTFFSKGSNTVYWYGVDDLARDDDAAEHGLYKIPTQFVDAGQYTIRGLWHKKVSLLHEFGVYNNGNPPWRTQDHTGAWLSNHSAPSSAMFVPATKAPTGVPTMFLGCQGTEGPDGLGWFDLSGKKLGGVQWLGGAWTSAAHLGRDMGPQALDGVYGYVATPLRSSATSVELRITPFKDNNNGKTVVVKLTADETDAEAYIGGIAVYNSIAVCSIPKLNKLIFVNTETGQIVDEFPLASPAGLAYQANRDLYVVSGKQLLCLTTTGTKKSVRVIVSKGLDEPEAVTTDANGLIYISDRGKSHQVKVFSSTGTFIRAIGHAGVPRTGIYDPLHMNNPAGIAIDSENQLWVTEEDYIPKRVSVWTREGAFIKAFYGPSAYGGGGVIDEIDKTRFYYADEDRGTMEFVLDWTNGTSQLTHVLYRNQPDNLVLPFRNVAPDTAIYRTFTNNGQKTQQRYFVNCYKNSPTQGHGTAFVFIERDHKLYPVAGMGKGMDWRDLFSQPEFASVIPAGIDIKGAAHQNEFFFIWSDLNGDAHVQPAEVSLHPGLSGGITIKKDFSFCVSRLGANQNSFDAFRFRPTAFTAQGVPQYDFSQKELLVAGTQNPASSGGDQVLVDDAGNVVVSLGIKPYDRLSLSGAKNGVPTWSYPSLWPGLHASHTAAKPTFAGEVIGSTRLLGDYFEPENSEVDALWAINGNMGNIYVFTMDGLFVATLFEDVRMGTLWRMPAEKRGMDLEWITLHDENFWPSITKTSDGKIYLMSGETTCIVRVDGLDDIRKISPFSLTVTAADLLNAQEQMIRDEALRQAKEGSGVMNIGLNTLVPQVDGNVDEWPDAWVEIEKSGEGANFNSSAKPYNYQGAMTVAEGKLFAAWKTADAKLLKNSGEMPLAPFLTGGTLELMIGTNDRADPLRTNPVAGDLRLSVTIVNGQTVAILYVPVDPAAKTAKVPFSSPWRTIEFDRVVNVSQQVQLAFDATGNYELSIPLAVLGLAPHNGMRISGDIGLLRGNGSQTLARIYWSNKATAIVSDVPSEAQLLPSLWGILEFN